MIFFSSNPVNNFCSNNPVLWNYFSKKYATSTICWRSSNLNCFLCHIFNTGLLKSDLKSRCVGFELLYGHKSEKYCNSLTHSIITLMSCKILEFYTKNDESYMDILRKKRSYHIFGISLDFLSWNILTGIFDILTKW